MTLAGAWSGIVEYDDGVHLAAAHLLADGQLPYRDFVFVQPPGVLLVLQPFVAISHLFGEQDALVAMRLAFVLVGCLNVGLVWRLLREHGTTATVAGAAFYAVWFPTVSAERTALLEPLLNLALLGALLYSGAIPRGPRPRPVHCSAVRAPSRCGLRRSSSCCSVGSRSSGASDGHCRSRPASPPRSRSYWGLSPLCPGCRLRPDDRRPGGEGARRLVRRSAAPLRRHLRTEPVPATPADRGRPGGGARGRWRFAARCWEGRRAGSLDRTVGRRNRGGARGSELLLPLCGVRRRPACRRARRCDLGGCRQARTAEGLAAGSGRRGRLAARHRSGAGLRPTPASAEALAAVLPPARCVWTNSPTLLLVAERTVDQLSCGFEPDPFGVALVEDAERADALVVLELLRAEAAVTIGASEDSSSATVRKAFRARFRRVGAVLPNGITVWAVRSASMG